MKLFFRLYIGGNVKPFPPLQVRGNYVVAERLLSSTIFYWVDILEYILTNPLIIKNKLC